MAPVKRKLFHVWLQRGDLLEWLQKWQEKQAHQPRKPTQAAVIDAALRFWHALATSKENRIVHVPTAAAALERNYRLSTKLTVEAALLLLDVRAEVVLSHEHDSLLVRRLEAGEKHGTFRRLLETTGDVGLTVSLGGLARQDVEAALRLGPPDAPLDMRVN